MIRKKSCGIAAKAGGNGENKPHLTVKGVPYLLTRDLKLADPPRLYVNADIAANLKGKLHGPYLNGVAAQVLHDADRLVRLPPLKEGKTVSWQAGTRGIDSRLQCLTCAWVLTRTPRYRAAAIRHLGGLQAWNQISCEANAATPAEPILPFCLSYGEMAHTTGLMYDLFRPEMTEAERQVFFGVFDRFLMKAALNCLTNPPWWANKEWSNWNGVCAGGMGIMALALYNDVPDAWELIPFVEQSLGEYFKSYIKNGGGCPEGTGYWNYGMTFAMRYLLSWENATGEKHPAFKIKELGDSLFFPLDFTGITFGDNDGWGPMNFFFLLARRLNRHNAALRAAACLPKIPKPKSDTNPHLRYCFLNGNLLYAADCIPTVAEMAKLKKAHQAKKMPVARVYKGMDWAVLADDEAFPALRMAVRGGSSEIAGHGMLDLLSFRCRVHGELMITDQQDGGYMATTFGKRGHEIYGRSVASKSSLFVDGLGCTTNVACEKTEVVKGRDILGIRVDASRIHMPWRKDIFVGRLILMVENSYWLVIDHVLSPNEVDCHWTESRFHTLAECTRRKDWVALTSGKERMTMTFAALGQAVLQESRGMPSQPSVKQTTIFRWLGAAAAHDNIHVAALNPGSQKLGIHLRKETNGIYAIEITKPGGTRRKICLTADLRINAQRVTTDAERVFP